MRLETQNSAMSWLLRAICKTKRPYTNAATSPKSKQNMQKKSSLGKGLMCWEVFSMAIAPWYITCPLAAKGQLDLKWVGRKWMLKKPLQSLIGTLSPTFIMQWTLRPLKVKQHLNCINYAFKDWSRPKETQKTYFFSFSYHEDHW